MRLATLAGLLSCSALAACATLTPPLARPPPPGVAANADTATPPGAAAIDRPIQSASETGFSHLVGWAEDDHVADFRAFVAGCGAASDDAGAIVCRRALAAGELDEPSARAFLEKNFRLEAPTDPGLLTAYFTPVYPAVSAREGDFTAPVRPRPTDLPRLSSPTRPEAPYADRAEIEARPAVDALAWMRPEDLFFMQIQGSGVLSFPTGESLRAVYDGSNGAPFVGLAAPMRRRGLLADNDTSAEGIRAWLSAHRGPTAEAVMNLNPRYVFFRLQPDDGVEPSGAAGLKLIPGRALAVDPTRHGMGEAFWVEATAPALTGAFPTYRRFAMALDTGSAIKGDARADLYLGRGPDAGLEAGRVRHILRLYKLTPVIQPQ